MALTKDVSRPERNGGPANRYGYKGKAGVRFFGRAILAVTAAGLACLPDDADAVAIVGLNEGSLDNTNGADGDVTPEAVKSVFGFPTLAGADHSNIGDPVYAADDDTIQLTNAGGELQAGTLEGISDGLFFVRF